MTAIISIALSDTIKKIIDNFPEHFSIDQRDEFMHFVLELSTAEVLLHLPGFDYSSSIDIIFAIT